MEGSQSFTLELIRPLETKRVQVLWVDVEGLTGNFVIGPDHSPLLSILKPKSRLLYKTIYNLEAEIDIPSGFIKVVDNNAIIVMEH